MWNVTKLSSSLNFFEMLFYNRHITAIYITPQTICHTTTSKTSKISCALNTMVLPVYRKYQRILTNKLRVWPIGYTIYSYTKNIPKFTSYNLRLTNYGFDPLGTVYITIYNNIYSYIYEGLRLTNLGLQVFHDPSVRILSDKSYLRYQMTRVLGRWRERGALHLLTRNHNCR